MKKTSRFEKLADLATVKEQEAAKTMSAVKQTKFAEESKLRQLISFRDQYSSQCLNSGNSAISVSRMLETRIFMDKISRAIEEQRTTVDAKDREHQAKNLEWTKARRYRLGLDKLVENERQLDVKIQQKREQSESDDRVLRADDVSGGMETA